MSDYSKGPIIEDRSEKPRVTILINADASLTLIRPDGQTLPYSDDTFTKMLLGFKSPDTGELTCRVDTKLAENASEEARERHAGIKERLKGIAEKNPEIKYSDDETTN